MAVIRALYRYPIKSFSPEALMRAELRPARALPGDRRFALAHGESEFDPAAPAWARKRNFLCLVHDDAVASVATAFDPATAHLRVSHGGATLFYGEVLSADGRAAASAAFNAVLKDRRGPLRLVDASDAALTDQQVPYLSFINLATVRELGEKAGAALDPVRFRGNVLVDGLAPWAEFDWVGKTLAIGGARLEVAKRIDRCMATAVNPATATRDVDTLKVLREIYGHIDCGVFGHVAAGGAVAVGDVITVQ